MSLRVRIAERMLLRKAVPRTGDSGFLHRLAAADVALLPLFPESVVRSLASVGFAILFSGVITFIATTSLFLAQHFAENPVLNWAIALVVGGLFCVSYLAIAHWVIRLSRFERDLRFLSLASAIALSLTFSFVCAASFKEQLLAREGVNEFERLRYEKQSLNRDRTMEMKRHDAPSSSDSAGERDEARRQANEKLAVENFVVTSLLMTFFFFVSWTPFLVLQSLRNSDYACLIAAIDGTNRIATLASGVSGKKT